MRFLVVDDEPIIRMDLVEILLDKNCTVVAEASDGNNSGKFSALNHTECSAYGY